jgi:predicted PurR-regulated permease PerM
MKEHVTNRLQSFTFLLLAIVIIGHLLIVARTLLFPIIIAIFLWHILNTIANLIKNSYFIGKHLPHWICLIFAVAIVVIVIYKLTEIITNNVNDVIRTAPRYQDNLEVILNSLGERFHIKAMKYINDFFNNLSFKNLVINIYALFTTITSNAFLIALYVGFLFLEQQVMKLKLHALFPKKKNLDLTNTILNQIVNDTQTYIGIKTVMSMITALTSWFIMKSVGLDFAEFWALLIFFLNFIPNIGSIIATAFPALLALIQYQESWWPFAIITSGIIATQFVVGNLIEPRFLGKSLNLSPLVILLALAVWGQLWGILGLFLSVPITVMMMIVFSNFEKTKPIAILLSQNGQIRHSS